MIVTRFGHMVVTAEGQIEHSGFEFAPSYRGEPDTLFGRIKAIQNAVANAKTLPDDAFKIIKESACI